MASSQKINVGTLRKMKKDGEKIVMMTAYDAPSAALAAESGIEILLIGDSVGMAMLGYDSTVPVTVDMMLHHCAAVRRGAPNAFIVGDMPFGICHADKERVLTTAMRFMQESFCDAVKLETDRHSVETVEYLIRAGIPVMAHIGLLPQNVKTVGTYKVVGRDAASAEELLQTAKALEKAGAFAIVLECIPAKVAQKISNELDIPTIGIGAGVHCDGQVQVITDLLGISSSGYLPKHAKRYAHLGDEMKRAFKKYAEEVKKGSFPGNENSF